MDPAHDEARARAVTFLRTHDDYLITSHDPPDADCIGSELALLHALEALGKTATIVNDGPPPRSFSFLPGLDEILTFEQASQRSFSCMVCVDSGSLANVRRPPSLVGKGAPVLNLDHHPSNEGFGTDLYVDPTASAAAVIVYRLIGDLGVELTLPMAMSLFAGIMSDTGRFSYSNTDAETLEIARDLVVRGVRPEVVHHHLFRGKPLALVHLEGAIARSVELHHGGRIAVARSSKALLTEHGLTQRDARDLVDIAMQIQGVAVALLLREMDDGTTKVSLRSAGKVDVNAVAQGFGGGGHRLASGCRLPEPPDQALLRLLQAVKVALEREG
jgi:phosphoesterase RecJ-like protein